MCNLNKPNLIGAVGEEEQWVPLKNALRINGLTPLSPDQEKEYQAWKTLNVQVGDQLVPESEKDYDYRGLFLDSKKTKVINPKDGKPHFTDYYKLPNHQTFSQESTYSNPSAGSWVANDFFLPSLQQMIIQKMLPDRN